MRDLLPIRRSLPLALFLLLCQSAVGAIIIEDNFNDDFLNTSLWGLHGAGGTVYEANNRLEFTGVAERAAYILSPIRGDFNITVDYTVSSLAGSSQFGLQLFDAAFGLTSPGEGPAVGRAGGAYGFVNPIPNPEELVTKPTSDTAGTFRLSRTGSTVSGFFWTGTNWSLLSSAPVGTQDWYVALVTNPEGPAFSVAYDNFSLTADSAVPEPGSLLLVMAGLFPALYLRRRHQGHR